MIRYLLLIGCFLLPFSTSPEDGVVFSFGIPFLIIFTAILYTLLLSLRVVAYPAIIMLPLFLMVIMSLSIVVSPNILQSVARLLVNILGFAIFGAVLIALRNRIVSASLIEGSLIIFGAVLAIYYIVNLLVKSVQYGFDAVVVERYIGGYSSLPWGASNNISAVLIFSLAAAIAAYGRDHGKTILLAVFIICFGILATFSRTGFLIVFAMFIFRGFLDGGQAARTMAIAVLSLIIIFGLVYLWQMEDYDSFGTMFADRFQEENVYGANGRFELWADRLYFFIEHPFQPIGYYGSLKAFNGITAHNAYITFLLEQSFLGLLVNILFLSLPFYGFISSRLSKADLPSIKYYILGLGLIMINLFVEDANFTQPYLIIFWLYMALLYGLIFERVSFFPGARN